MSGFFLFVLVRGRLRRPWGFEGRSVVRVVALGGRRAPRGGATENLRQKIYL